MISSKHKIDSKISDSVKDSVWYYMRRSMVGSVLNSTSDTVCSSVQDYMLGSVIDYMQRSSRAHECIHLEALVKIKNTTYNFSESKNY